MQTDWHSEIARQRTATSYYFQMWQEKLAQADTAEGKQTALQQLAELCSYRDLLQNVPAYIEWRLRPFQSMVLLSIRVAERVGVDIVHGRSPRTETGTF